MQIPWFRPLFMTTTIQGLRHGGDVGFFLVFCVMKTSRRFEVLEFDGFQKFLSKLEKLLLVFIHEVHKGTQTKSFWCAGKECNAANDKDDQSNTQEFFHGETSLSAL